MGFRGSRVQIPPSRFCPRLGGAKSFRRAFANAARFARGFGQIRLRAESRFDSENAVVANDNGVFLFPGDSPVLRCVEPGGFERARKFFLTTRDKVQYFVLSFERLSSEVSLG
jgi:hypothetical protein